MTLGARLFGTIRKPRATFQAVARNPQWLGLMAALAVASSLAGAAVFQTTTGRLALVDQWERAAIAFGQEIDDERYEQLHALSEQGSAYAVLRALLTGPALTMGVSALLFLVFRGGAGPDRTTFHQTLAMVTHTSIILTLRQVIAAPLIFARETTASATSVGSWFPGFDESSPVARFLGSLDLFVIWWVVVLAIGASVLYRRRPRTLAAAFVGAYVAVAAAMATTMAVLGGTA